jgi:hypothetical protein
LALAFSILFTAFFSTFSLSATLPPAARSSALAHLSRSSISARFSAGSPARWVWCFWRWASAWEGLDRVLRGALDLPDEEPEGRETEG